ncbi:uncharacterized protein BXIN_2216 [Babesia sp. Xinjiang]|uniref:uncharacterized protein n=1 Tax=Babesia sp. Xinjiang TaxID=462227 RepID=UPI000A2609A2|nr:uncharacterized protein BXIN_2216 [Babesia sp. Xinjiang]ORM39606.1 hypothetical protein BXIN_2216 [Babesia sp. Xinjiang]
MSESCGCNGKGQHNKLTCPPGNLKESIDWILRVTNKDGLNGGKNGNATKLGEEVAKLLENDRKVLEKVIPQLNNGQLITNLAEKLATFIGWNGGGKLDGSKGIAKNGYTSSYKKEATWSSAENDQQLYARIFLGTIPVIFSGLSYLYWQCNEGNGSGATGDGTRWTPQYINQPSNPLGIYFVCCGYDLTKLNQNKKGQQVGTTCFQQFTEFTNGATNGTANGTANVSDPYPEYIKEVLTNNNNTNVETHPLTALYICSTYYFQSQFNNAGTRTPTTIREMLYWLMALPYSGCFQYAEQEIKNGIKKHSNTDTIKFIVGPILNPTDPLDCLISTTCHYAAVVLSTMQGTLITKDMTKTDKEKLTLTDIYSNTAFNFEYPTTAGALFPVLWDIIYCLLSQLYFLRRQCADTWGEGCGWNECQYGKDINPNTGDNATPLTNWICQQGTNHPKNCGKEPSSPSPLQAFLCDYLTPFQCESLKNKKCEMKNGQLVSTNGVTPVPYSDHVSHRNFNQYCPVPMGFNHEMLTQTDRTGDCIYWILVYFTQSDRNSVTLYNTIICLMCCSLRTPRTVGDLFAFFLCAGLFLYLGEEMKTGGSPNVAKAIQNESMKIPWSTGSNAMINAAKKLAEYHNSRSHTPEATLHSLYDSNCGSGKTCGKYLQSLSYSIYRNISTTFAMSYLSRIVYLTDVLKDGLELLLTEFNNLKCEHCDKCTPKHIEGDHGKDMKCLCPTIVQCADVLPLFFKFGFLYYSHSALNGKYERKSDWLRNCSQFATQLNAVIDDVGLFKNLLDEIDKFLFCIRKPFLYYLLTFWLIAILYFSYGLTIPLDLFHIRSHWRPALSHQISVLALLSHRAMSPTKVGYFTP